MHEVSFLSINRIQELLTPFLVSPLAAAQLDHISIYIDLLLRWNARINLTAIRDPESIVTRHFGESLFLARHLFPPGEPAEPVDATRPRVLDIGSGAGFPGLPLKIWAPAISLTLVESNHKKATFLREVVRALTLIDVNVTTERAESLSPPPGTDAYPPVSDQQSQQRGAVTLRAVERFDQVLPTAISLVGPGGRIALLIGQSQVASLPDSIQWQPPRPVPGSRARVLSIGVRPGQVG